MRHEDRREYFAHVGEQCLRPRTGTLTDSKHEAGRPVTHTSLVVHEHGTVGLRFVGEGDRDFVVTVEDRVNGEVLRRTLDRRWHAAGEDDRQPFVRMHECRASYESCDHPVDGADSNISATAIAAKDLIKLVVAVRLLHAARI